MSTLQRAIEIATLAHQGQVDKSGNDYIGHPLRVMEMGRTEDERIVGVLHDVVENTRWSFEALQAYKKLIGEPVYSIYAARQENPNAYDPWTEEADTQLRQMWEDGTSVADIAQHFGRKQSAIIVRMKKLEI